MSARARGAEAAVTKGRSPAALRSSSAALGRLRRAASGFDASAQKRKRQALEQLARTPLAAGAGLLSYHETLLFLRAHPSDASFLARVERELGRIAAFLGRQPAAARESLRNEGLPHADTVTRFSHDCVRWLLAQPGCRVVPDHRGEAVLGLNAVLRLTLPAPEWGETTAGLADDDLLGALGIAPSRRLAFIVEELARYDAQPFLKDLLFEALDLFVRVKPRARSFSRAFNRLPMGAVSFQGEMLRRFDHLAVMNRRLPAPRDLDAPGGAEVVRVIRTALALTCRETDPGTYLDERSLRLFDLERGISVAIFGMTAERQLPYESYVGFMLFKNGLALAYGGAWVLGERAEFGMNIFEPYRGGESGLVMSQLVRVYRQAFGVRYFEVDAHQFGRDNPEGIASGAFWFYYRYGFRPLDVALARRAERESARLAARPGARSTNKTLLAFTGSNMVLNFGGPAPPALANLTSRISTMIRTRWAGSRSAAERDCVAGFVARGGPAGRLGAGAERVRVEVAMFAAALRIEDQRRLRILRRMVRVKPVDLFGYQRLLLALLARAA